MTKTARSGKATPQLPEMLDRVPPYDLEAEHAVLGSVLLAPDLLDDVGFITSPADFYDDANRILYTHMRQMHEPKERRYHEPSDDFLEWD